MSGQYHGEAYMTALVTGVAMLIISFALNTIGSTAQPVGNMVPIPNGLGGYNYIPQEGYAYPYQSLIPVGRVFLVMGLILLSIGALMARQRLMKPKVTHNLSPYLIGSDAWKVDTMIESLGSSSWTDPSRRESVSVEPHLAVGGSSGHYSDAQTTDSALSSPADSESSVEAYGGFEATSTQTPFSSPVKSRTVKPRNVQRDLELHLSQLRFSRDNGLLTRQEYEDKKNELMKEFQLSLVAMDGPMSFKY
jgi:hypothetical protein